MSVSPAKPTDARAPLGRAGDLLWLAGAAGISALQQVAIRLMPTEGNWEWARAGIFFVTTAVVLAMAFHFRRFLGAWVVALGILMNFIPMAAHGGLMPASYELIASTGDFPQVSEDSIGKQLHRSKDIILREDDIRFEPLSDNLHIILPVYGPNIYSPGDLVLFSGVLLTIVQAALEVSGVPLPRLPRRRITSVPGN